MSENIHPNLVQITEFQRGAHLSSFSSTSLDKSGESDRVTMRRRIRGPSKQKKGERCRSHRDCECGEEPPASSMWRRKSTNSGGCGADPPIPMSCIFWNFQRIRLTLAAHGFGVLLRKIRPDVIFLSETRGSSHSINSLKEKWNLNGAGVSSVGAVKRFGFALKEKHTARPCELLQKSHRREAYDRRWRTSSNDHGYIRGTRLTAATRYLESLMRSTY